MDKHTHKWLGCNTESYAVATVSCVWRLDVATSVALSKPQRQGSKMAAAIAIVIYSWGRIKRRGRGSCTKAACWGRPQIPLWGNQPSSANCCHGAPLPMHTSHSVKEGVGEGVEEFLRHLDTGFACDGMRPLRDFIALLGTSACRSHFSYK
jgi:hypothetical protein